VQREEDPVTRIEIVLNWTQALRRQLSSGEIRQ
jgi:hypothetical protein